MTIETQDLTRQMTATERAKEWLDFSEEVNVNEIVGIIRDILAECERLKTDVKYWEDMYQKTFTAFAETSKDLRLIKEECERLKELNQVAATALHKTLGKVETLKADAHVMAEQIRKDHAGLCNWCPYQHSPNCKSEDDYCCTCPACEISRKYGGENA